MVKAKRKIMEELKLVDIVIELLDARIPMSSRNPEIENIVGNKKRIIVLNKSDLADPAINMEWIDYFNREDKKAIPVDSVSGKGLKDILSASGQLMKEKLNRLKSKGLLLKTVRALIIGIPNVGKSTLINKLAGRNAAQTGDKPGITKAKQWIKVGPELELLDTPGILWPKFEDERAGMNLAFTGAIKDEILDINRLSQELLAILADKYPEKLNSRYKLGENEADIAPGKLMEIIGRKRGCIISGGDIDMHRVSALLLDEFRCGKIGRISLESPKEFLKNIPINYTRGNKEQDEY